MTLTACIDCGEPTESTRCDDCRPAQDKLHRQGRPDRKGSPRSRGYDTQWDRLSKRARILQPWCSDCGATDDLQGDHSTEAWERRAAGLSLRLRDIEVVCGPCNRLRGAQRPNQDPRGHTPAGQEGDPLGSEAIFPSHIVGSDGPVSNSVSERTDLPVGWRGGRSGCRGRAAGLDLVGLGPFAGCQVVQTAVVLVAEDPAALDLHRVTYERVAGPRNDFELHASRFS